MRVYFIGGPLDGFIQEVPDGRMDTQALEPVLHGTLIPGEYLEARAVNYTHHPFRTQRGNHIWVGVWDDL